MVLVTYRLENHTSILQTKLGYREGYKARRRGLEAMPLDQHIEGRHGEREPGVERRPDPMHNLLQVHDDRQHREHRLHQHTVLPLPTLTQFQVGWIALRGMEGGVAQDNHLLFDLPNEPLKRVIRDIGGRTLPPHAQTVL